MTTNSFNTVLDHTSDAGFRAWGSELAVSFAAVGLVQTSDTGQINWTTVLRPGAGLVGGYEIWRFSDSSLYVKFEYGTGSSANYPNILVTVGTGSNGSGNITGQTSTRNMITSLVAPSSTVVNYLSYVCHTASCFSLLWKNASAVASAYPMGFLVIGKAVDASGSPNLNGFAVLRDAGNSNSPTLQSVKLTSVAATNNDSANFIVFPGSPTSSQTGSSVQAYLCWMNIHQVAPFAWACGYLRVEQLPLTPFSVSLVSTPSHTYLPIGLLTSGTINGQPANNYSLAILYE